MAVTSNTRRQKSSASYCQTLKAGTPGGAVRAGLLGLQCSAGALLRDSSLAVINNYTISLIDAFWALGLGIGSLEMPQAPPMPKPLYYPRANRAYPVTSPGVQSLQSDPKFSLELCRAQYRMDEARSSPFSCVFVLLSSEFRGEGLDSSTEYHTHLRGVATPRRCVLYMQCCHAFQ